MLHIGESCSDPTSISPNDVANLLAVLTGFCWVVLRLNHEKSGIDSFCVAVVLWYINYLRSTEKNQQFSEEVSTSHLYPLPIGSMYAIYGNIYHQHTPNVSIYIYHTWILWVDDWGLILGLEIPRH